jgi:hypothetical protein
MKEGESESPAPNRSPAGPLEAALGRYFGNVVFTNLFGLIVLLGLVWACIQLGQGSPKQQIAYGVIGLIGALLGWASGMYFAPHGQGEQSKFVTLGQAVSAFASGYLVSKIDRFVEATLFPQSGVTGGEWLGAGIFVGAFLNAALVVYSNRSYFREG